MVMEFLGSAIPIHAQAEAFFELLFEEWSTVNEVTVQTILEKAYRCGVMHERSGYIQRGDQPAPDPDPAAGHEIMLSEMKQDAHLTALMKLADAVRDLRDAKTCSVALVFDRLNEVDGIRPVQTFENDKPITEDFLQGVVAEKDHQVRRWGTTQDRNKAPADWFWLLGYLGGKALHAHNDGDREKALHHTISSAAVLAHWHDAIKNGGPSLKVEHDPSKKLFESNPDPTRASDLEKHLGVGESP